MPGTYRPAFPLVGAGPLSSSVMRKAAAWARTLLRERGAPDRESCYRKRFVPADPKELAPLPGRRLAAAAGIFVGKAIAAEDSLAPKKPHFTPNSETGPLPVQQAAGVSPQWIASDPNRS